MGCTGVAACATYHNKDTLKLEHAARARQNPAASLRTRTVLSCRRSSSGCPNQKPPSFPHSPGPSTHRAQLPAQLLGLPKPEAYAQRVDRCLNETARGVVPHDARRLQQQLGALLQLDLGHFKPVVQRTAGVTQYTCTRWAGGG
eukprot:356275-Chlamydomonas_euryale.AAC.5